MKYYFICYIYLEISNVYMKISYFGQNIFKLVYERKSERTIFNLFKPSKSNLAMYYIRFFKFMQFDPIKLFIIF